MASVIREAKAVRQNHAAKASLIIRKLEDSITDINSVYEMNVHLQKNVLDLKEKVKNLEDEESFSQALCSQPLFSQSTTTDHQKFSQSTTIDHQKFSQSTTIDHQNDGSTFDEALASVSEDQVMSLPKKQKIEKDI